MIREIEQVYPQAEVTARSVALVAVIGRDLTGERVLGRGLQALHEGEIDVLAAQQTPRNVDAQFVVPRDAGERAVRCLHGAFVSGRDDKPVARAA